MLARARDSAFAGTSAGAAAGEVDLAGLAEQVTEQSCEISALARTIARMRRRLEDEGSWWPRPQRTERGGALTRCRAHWSGFCVGKIRTTS